MTDQHTTFDDGKELGCVLYIYFVPQRYIISERQFIMWLKKDSGITQEYLGKILAVHKAMLWTVQVQFDITANCFEFMQQFKRLEFKMADPNGGLLEVHRIHAIECPCGIFALVQRELSPDIPMKSMKNVAIDLSEHSDVLRIERCQFEGVYTGTLKAVVFIKRDSRLVDREWLRENREYKVFSFIPSLGRLRIDAGRVQELWEKYGHEKERMNAALLMKLAIAEKICKVEQEQNSIAIGQVD